MEIREALQAQAPSLPLVRAAVDEIARLDAEIARLRCLVDGYAAAPSAAREREALTDEIAQLISDLDGAYTPHEMAKQIAQRFAAPAPAPADAQHQPKGTAEAWLRSRYGAYRGHFAWRELEEAFNAGAASGTSGAAAPMSVPTSGHTQPALQATAPGTEAHTLIKQCRDALASAPAVNPATTRVCGHFAHASAPASAPASAEAYGALKEAAHAAIRVLEDAMLRSQTKDVEARRRAAWTKLNQALTNLEAKPQPKGMPTCPQAIVEAITAYGDARADQDANDAPTTSPMRLADCIRLIRAAMAQAPAPAQAPLTDAQLHSAWHSIGEWLSSESAFRRGAHFAESVLAAAPSPAVAPPNWLPIEDAPLDGRTLLLGYANSAGRWRTLRGQWMSADYIAENWENPDDGEPGWYETSVENDDVPNCWRTRPTHYMPLPAAPDSHVPVQGSQP